MDRRLRLIIGAALAGGVALTAGYIIFTSGSPSYEVAIGQPIRQDDFLYTVVGVTKARTVGDDAHKAVAHGVFYVTTIEVDNQAVRVGYQWDPSIVYVSDDTGKRYAMTLDGQRALDTMHPVDSMVDAGRSARYEVVFDLPADARHPVLGFANGVMMGDVFNGAAYTRARVPLE